MDIRMRILLQRLVLLVPLVIFTVAVVSGPVGSVDAKGEKVKICHRTDRADYPWSAIDVTLGAQVDHMAHGDYAYAGDPTFTKEAANSWCQANDPATVAPDPLSVFTMTPRCYRSEWNNAYLDITSSHGAEVRVIMTDVVDEIPDANFGFTTFLTYNNNMSNYMIVPVDTDFKLWFYEMIATQDEWGNDIGWDYQFLGNMVRSVPLEGLQICTE